MARAIDLVSDLPERKGPQAGLVSPKLLRYVVSEDESGLPSQARALCASYPVRTSAAYGSWLFGVTAW